VGGVVADIAPGVCGERVGVLWCVGVLVLVEAWKKVVAFNEVGAGPSSAR
jgi:hypothetical protein